MRVARTISLIGLGVASAGGCATNPYTSGSRQSAELEQRALATLRQGMRYEVAPVVRCQAVEAMRLGAPETGLPWIRAALRDESAIVRFAACVALGELRDADSQTRIRGLLSDPNPSVQVAAIFALHRLGDPSQTHRLADTLLYGRDAAARRNAAMVLGKLGEPGAVQILARVMNNRDEGLRLQALESMAQLGSREAMQELQFIAHSGLGAMEVLAITALGSTEDGRFIKMYRYKLQTATHIETKLAAARALGRLGSSEGLSVAMKNLKFNAPQRGGAAAKDDSPVAQIVRTRTMAALALGAIGDLSALPALVAAMDDPYDPRVELAVALATLQILDKASDTRLSFTRAQPP